MARHKLILLLSFVLASFRCFCDVIPAENSKLNYTTIYFEESLQKDATDYELTVYTDSLLQDLVAKKKQWTAGLLDRRSELGNYILLESFNNG